MVLLADAGDFILQPIGGRIDDSRGELDGDDGPAVLRGDACQAAPVLLPEECRQMRQDDLVGNQFRVAVEVFPDLDVLGID